MFGRIKNLLILFIGCSVSPVFALDGDIAIDITKQISLADAKRIVSDLVQSTKTEYKDHYCLKGEMTCRVHYTLVNQKGERIRAFIAKFLSADRSVASQGFFFPVKDHPNQYIRFENLVFDGKLDIDKIESGNLVEVQKNADNRVSSISGIVMPKLGTTKYAQANVSISPQSIVIEGEMKDSADPGYSQHLRLEYFHIDL